MRGRIFLVLAIAIVLVAAAYYKISDSLNHEESIKTSINSLEDKIGALVAEQKSESDENRYEIEKLKLEIEKLKNEKGTADTNETEKAPTGERFTYEVKDEGAVITGYTGKDTYIVIPSHIDGYEVVGIGESAFASSKTTSVIISEGIKYIDWFAFYTCPHLTSITIPKSVEKIGYAAFDGASPSFTVYCNKDSYAYDFVKSYGLSYITA